MFEKLREIVLPGGLGGTPRTAVAAPELDVGAEDAL